MSHKPIVSLYDVELIPRPDAWRPTGNNATRQWKNPDDFVREIGDARVWGGLHYRFSVDPAAAMGRRIGELAAAKVLVPAH